MRSSLVSLTVHVVVIGLLVLHTTTEGIARTRPAEHPPVLIWNPPRAAPHEVTGKGWFGGPVRPFDPGPVPTFITGLVPQPIDSRPAGGGPWVPASDTAWDSRPSRDNGGQRTSGVLSADVVDVQVTPCAGAPTPRYPETLRDAGIEGEVVLEFVVDTMGRADLGSIRVLSTPSDVFVVSVRDALAATRYHPALVGGQRVRQIVRQGFVFSLTQH
jgi:protein TonB